MAFTLKSKRMAYDNIAAGSVTGLERHNLAAGVGDQTSREGYDNISTSDVATSYQINRVIENLVGWPGVANVSDSNVHGAVGPVDTDLTPTSATTPGYTSTTSFTTAVGELLA